MGKIVLLDELTINQIAAGEVIERPASVVKEMLENSIDAGAKNITVEVKNGGISLIRITDDGCGISEDDMEIAFERHATSKIRSAEDLQKVKTMGFRGEALASICAIANVEMISKTENDDVGHKIVVEGGKVLEKSEVGTVTGTKITVQNLFYNTPVRYKFLKKDYTEAGYIEDVVTRIAIINKDVAIKLINNDKVLLQTTGSLDTKNLIYSIYGREIANGVKEVEYTYEDIKVTGVVGLPMIARSNRSNQLFFVNGRFVRDKNLTAGIEQAYKNLIPSGKYAFAILNLEMNPNEVDVNVHPAKLEVRFQDEQKVFKAVYHTVKYALEDVSPINNNIFDEAVKPEEIKQEVVKSKEENPDAFATKNSENPENVSNDEELEEHENKKGFGLFKKFKKNKEDEDDDEKDNTLLEIFNARKLGKDLSKPLDFINKEESTITEKVVENVVDEIPKGQVSEDVMLTDKKEEFIKNEDGIKDENKDNSKENSLNEVSNEALKEESLSSNEEKVSQTLEEKMMIANNDIAEKEIKLGDTLVSSNTRELDFNVIEALKDKTLIMDSISKMEKQETVAIPSTRQTVSAETQIIESVNNLSKENVNVPEEIEKISDDEKTDSDTKELNLEENKLNDENSSQNSNQETQEVSETSNINSEETLESTVPSLDAVEKITSKILEMKMNNLDSTQMIDTSKVREAMLEEQEITPEFANMYKKTFGLDANQIRKERELEEQKRERINVSNDFVSAKTEDIPENDSLFESSAQTKSRVDYRFVGIAFDHEIIIEYKNEMYIIDETSARERLNLEKVKYNYYSEEKDSSVLLLPDIVTCSFKEMSIAKENVELFRNVGFEFEEFGENTLKLIAVPSMCEELNTKNLFLNIINEIGNIAVNDIEEKERKFIRAVAVNSTVKAKRRLDEKEVDYLLQELLSLEDPFTEEQGKPTAIKMSRGDIEKKFARRK